jgi:hypothetical protein
MLNEHDVTSMRPAEPELQAAFDRIFREESIVLKLTDQSPRDRLLGIEIDMDYSAKSSPRADELLEV